MHRREPIAREGSAPPDCRATLLDTALERPTDRPVQPRDLLCVQAIRRFAGVDSRAVQRLVDVDVAQPRDHSLIEQRLLDRDAAALQASGEIIASKIVAAGSLGSESKRPERGVDGIGRHETPPAELPDVAVVGDRLAEAQGEMGRLVRKRTLGIGHGMTRHNPRAIWPEDRKLTGQLEVGQHAQPIRPMGDQDFSATISAQQRPAHEQPQIGKWRVANQFRQCQLEPRQRATNQLALDNPADGFDFRELGHSSLRAVA
jgi:hypothetical protein